MSYLTDEQIAKIRDTAQATERHLDSYADQYTADTIGELAALLGVDDDEVEEIWYSVL